MSAEGTVLHLNVAPHLFPSKTPLKNTTLETNNGIVTIAPANIGVDFYAKLRRDGEQKCWPFCIHHPSAPPNEK